MSKLFILPLVNFVLMPGNIVGLIVNDHKLVNYLSQNWQFIASLVKEENQLDLSKVGCLCEIISIQKIHKNTYIIQLKASKRIKIKKIEFEEIYPFTQNYQIIEQNKNKEHEDEKIKDIIITNAQRYINIDDSFFQAIKNKDLCTLTDIVVSIMKIKAKIKQEFLEEIDCIKRAEKLINLFEKIFQRWPGKIITLKSFYPKPQKTIIFTT